VAYAQKQDIVDLHGEEFVLLIALRAEEEALVDPLTAAAITDALAQASSEADTYIVRRYPVPVTRPPRVLEMHVINMACHHLASTADRMTEIIRQRYEDAQKWLINISKGIADLPPGEDDDGNTIAEPSPSAAIFSSAEPMFKRGGS